MSARSAEEAGVKVIVRFRPVNDRERAEDGGQRSSVKCSDDGQISISLDADEMPKRYKFDHVFYDQSPQEDIYNRAAKATIEDVKAGYNGTLFAYGQTGSGKTFSMFGPRIGDASLRGIIPRACMDILNMVNTDKKNVWEVHVSYLELYNERINDLINTANKDLKVMERMESGSKVVYVRDLHEERVRTINEVYELIVKGEMARAQAATKMNQESSRSHCVFMLKLRKMCNDDPSRMEREGRLYMVDLAGSEKLSKTGATGAAAHEAKSINQSLSTLGRCIKVIGDIQAFKRREEEREREAMAKGKPFKPSRKTMPQVPFRDSQLTRILQDSLVGNTKTTLVVACSPAKYNLLETVSTLEFAKRAKMLVNVVKINRQYTRAQLMAMLEALKKEVEALTIRNTALLKKLAWYKENSGVHPAAAASDGEDEDEGGPSAGGPDGDGDGDGDDDGGVGGAVDPKALAELRMQLVELQAKADAEIAELTESLEAATAAEEEAAEEMTELHEMVAELEEELHGVHEAMEEMGAAAEADATESLATIQELESKVETLMSDLELLQKDKNELVAALEEKDEDMADMAELTDATEAELEHVQAKLVELAAEAQAGVDAVSAMEELKIQMEEAKATLAEREAELVAALEAGDAEAAAGMGGGGGDGDSDAAAQAAARVTELEAEVDTLRRELAEAQEHSHTELESAMEQLEEVETERSVLADKVATLTEQLDGKFTAELSPEDGDAARVASLTAELEQVRSSLAEAKDSKAAMVDELRTELAETRVELSEAQARIDELTKSKGEVTQSRVLKLATKRNEELHEQVETLQTKVTTMKSHVATIEAVAPLAEAATVVSKALEVETALAQARLKAQRAMGEKNKLEHELLIARQLAASAEAKLAAQVGQEDRFSTRLEAAQSELESMRASYKTATSDLKNAQADLLIRDARIAELEAMLDAAQSHASASSSGPASTPAPSSLAPGRLAPTWTSKSRGKIDFGMDGALDFRVIRQRLAKTESQHLKAAQEEAARADAAFLARMNEETANIDDDVAANMGFSW